MRILASLSVALLIACSSKSPAQSFHDGVQALCDLPSHVPAPNGDSFEKRLAVVSDWAEHNITNPEAKQVGGLKGSANKDALAAAVAKASIQHCQLLDNGMELQSFAEAIAMVCDVNVVTPGYFKSHLLNSEVIRLFESLGDVNPAERATRVHDALARAGVTSCPFVEKTPANVNAPTVPDAGLVELGTNPTTTITTSAITIEGKAIVAVTNGDVDPADKEGGALGIKIPVVAKFAQALSKEPAKDLVFTNSEAPLAMTLVVDPATPYRLLIEAMFSIKSGGYGSFLIAVHAGTAVKAIPIALPEKQPPPQAGKPTAPPPLKMIVSLTKDKLILWSISGIEGSLQKPAVATTPDHLADVQKALAAIVDKHWHDGKRTPDDLKIIVQADDKIPMQAVAELIAGVRTAADGKALFPSVLLSSGFE